jgi:Family of unknown function (DUF6328)
VSDNDNRDTEPGESRKERSDRELIELLNEVRVALPGVQVLFAFLLAVPFAQGWTRVTDFQKDVFFVAFIATTLSSALLIAPSSYHRLLWRRYDKKEIVETANWLTIAGLFALAVAIEAAVLLVGDYLFSRTEAIITTVCVGVFIAVFWYGLALGTLLRDRRS